jgi:hypothetical protein
MVKKQLKLNNMKYIYFLLITLLLTSCERSTYKHSNVKGVITSKDSTESYSKYEYHYGYSAWRGKFCWHWGNKHHAAQYTTKFVVEADTITIGQTNYKVHDTIQVIKTLVINEEKKVVDTRYSIK